MNKAKVISAVLAAAMLTSVVAISASAYDKAGKSFGVCGEFNGWADDVVMTESNGVYTAEVKIDSVQQEWLEKELLSDGTPTGKYGLQFKVRGVGSWDDSWGQYEQDSARTYNSQTNCLVEGLEAGKPVTIKVTFDTTKMDAAKIAEGGDVDPADEYLFWGVTYEVVKEEAPAAKTESKTEESQPASTPATESKTETTPATGDATSAAALVGVVLASLGAAVVMTKKASSKE